MNTKTFAQQARKILLKGVRDKLLYWGFSAKGQAAEQPQAVAGGYLFRGEVYNDPQVPKLWQSLHQAIQLKGLEQVAEEAAYTWFNRMMAMQILAKNGYDPAQLEFAEGAGRLPLILQRAQRGTYPFLTELEKKRLQPLLADHSREVEALGILLVGYCHSHSLLQTVFGHIDDYTELLLPDDMLTETGFLNLLHTTDAITDEEYRKVELIGWLYQFYISEKKDEVFAGFKKNKKAEAADIPAATQIFTPNWIVKYLVQNTVGKLWLDLHPSSPLKVDMKYLVEGDNPAYGNPIISEIAQLKLLDPAVGSGHILVEGFDLLYDMYLAEYYPPEEAVESILQNNLFGLDIDKRAAQLAQFAVLLKAAAKRPEILKRGIRPHIYAMPEPRPFSRQEVMDFLGKDGLDYADALVSALQLMQQAQNLGSIMQFKLSEAAVAYITQRWTYFQQAEELSFYEKALLPALQAYLPVLLVLGRKYEAVVANPPYMGQGTMNGELKNYVSEEFPISKFDLFTVFLELGDRFLNIHGCLGMITIHSWMFILSYEQLRAFIIKQRFIKSLLHIGFNTFPELNSKVAQGCAFVIVKDSSKHDKGLYLDLNSAPPNADKEKIFFMNQKDGKYYLNNQTDFIRIPGSPIAYWVKKNIAEIFKKSSNLEEFARCRKGLTTAKDELFVRLWHEISICKFNKNNANVKDEFWLPLNKGGGYRKWYGNKMYVIDWENNGKRVKEFPNSYIRAEEYYRKEGVTWNSITSKNFTGRYLEEGAIFNDAGPSIFNIPNIYFLLAWLNSNSAGEIFKILCPTLKFEVGMLQIFPVNFDFATNQIEGISKNSVSISKSDWDSRETSWDFQHSPLLNQAASLRQAYETWQSTATQDFFQLHTNEEELNRIFIDIYGLQDELSSEVPLKDITILQEELSGKDLETLEPLFRSQGAAGVALPIQRAVVMQQFVSYLIGLCMGRYRLDRPGLHIAHPQPSVEELAPYLYNEQRVEIDEDAIIPLMGSECSFPDDALERIKSLLDVIWGPDTRTDNLNFLQECLNQDLEQYLLKQFWKDHCRRYKKKPIYWLFSSPGGAFQVLVYMHRMHAFTVERIRDKYLLPQLQHLRSKVQEHAARSAQLSSQEARQLDRWRKDLAECEAYELQLKTVADQQIVFDLDDGVTANYALFQTVMMPIK